MIAVKNVVEWLSAEAAKSVMSSELYERFAQINRIDQAIYEAEKEVEDGGEPISMDSSMERLNKKYYGWSSMRFRDVRNAKAFIR